MYTLRQALNIMEQEDLNGDPIPFSLKAYTYNEVNDSGGDVFEVPRAILTRTGKVSERKQKKFRATISEIDRLKKDPNHSDNLTRNITLLPSMNIRKIHIHLITRLNDERVI